MTVSDDLNQAADRNNVPRDWRPYTEHTDQIGEAIVKLPRPNATENDLLIGAGFAPTEWQISGPINTRKWMRYDGEWLYYYKFNVIAGESQAAAAEHVDDLVRKIRRRKPVTKSLATGKDGWAYIAADWQIGKREGDIGTDVTIDRVLESFDNAVRRVRELRRIGRAMPHGAIVGTGDIVEGCHSFYPGQPFMVDRTRRDQNKITRELISYGIDQLSPLFEQFTVASVGGNHGEHRNDGSRATDDSDNDDVACFEAVREAYDRAGLEFEWVLPYEELSIAVEIGGVNVGFTHGHTFRKGSTPQQKALEWFKGQVFGMQAVSDCRILVSSHFHHFLGTQVGERWMYQTPAMDPGSKWHSDSTGERSGPAAMTIRFDADHPFGHGDVALLTPSA